MKYFDDNNNKSGFVSVVIPCRNEEGIIAKCLESLVLQDYPKEKIEILVVDGMSEDGTREIVKNISKSFSFIKLIDNPKKKTPFAMNVGIKNSNGGIIIIMGAHADYENNYISKCVNYLNSSGADCVGGEMKIRSLNDTFASKAISLTLSSLFGAGNAHYKVGKMDKPRKVDTVFGACYRKNVFERIGFFNEQLTRNQDLEFNLRLKNAGGRIMLFPDVASYYYPKADFLSFFKHNFEDGFWVIYPIKFGVRAFSWRHLTPLFFVAGLMITGIAGLFDTFYLVLFFVEIIIYLAINIYFSIKIAIENKNIKYVVFLLIAFLCRHVGYGLGSLWAALKLLKFKIYERGRKN